MYRRHRHHFPGWLIGVFFIMFMIFGGFRFLFFLWPLFFIMPCVFWFSRHKARHYSSQWNYENEWEKPKRKNDEHYNYERYDYEKPKRQDESEIYYF
jgi:hypothetical protein